MSTLFNADTSDGLKITSDTSGIIELQNAGTTKLTVNSSGATVAGTLAATSVTGTGSGLTSLTAANLTGTVADARIATLTASKLTGALPAIDGSSLTGVDSLPSQTGNAGKYLTTNASSASWGTLPASGKVLQVVSTIVNTQISGTAAQGGNTAAMISLAITPSSSSSKILVMYTVTVGPSYDNFSTQSSVFRGGTQIFQAASSGSRQRVTTSNVNGNNNKNLLSNSFTGLDTPSTTSAVTYDIRLSSSNDGGTATLYLNRASLNTDSNVNVVGASSITLMEIGA